MENVDMSSLTETVDLTQNVLTQAGVALIGNLLIYAGMLNVHSSIHVKKVSVNLRELPHEKDIDRLISFIYLIVILQFKAD